MSRTGKQTFIYDEPPLIASHVSIVGPKEGKGPLGGWFDTVIQDDLLGQKSWEKAESEMLRRCALDAAARAGMPVSAVQLFMAGDLNAQIIASGFCARELKIPFLGLYGACSTFVEGMVVGSALISGGMLDNALFGASSHFCTAERQFRMPLEMGTQRTPSAQWTATAAGAAVVGRGKKAPFIRGVTFGRIVDMGIKDANNMGAAMAPAAADTVAAHLRETGRDPDFYDLIVTGDLGSLGSELFLELPDRRGVVLSNHADCGCMIFDPRWQDVHCGGSGCGCCASVLTALLLPGLQRGKWAHILFCPTGALHSPTATFQGESIPGICHAVALSSRKETPC